MYPKTLSKETSAALSSIKDSVREFYLAGGTALALLLGHRISIDLDFFCIDDFSTREIAERLKKKGRLEISSQSEGTLNGSLNGVKEYGGVRLADERDIAAMKILAISDRGSKKDFVDLFVLLKKYKLHDILEFFNEKYKEYNYNMLHILKSLIYFFDADEDPEPIYIKPIIWDEVKISIKIVVDEYTVSQI